MDTEQNSLTFQFKQLVAVNLFYNWLFSIGLLQSFAVAPELFGANLRTEVEP